MSVRMPEPPCGVLVVPMVPTAARVGLARVPLVPPAGCDELGDGWCHELGDGGYLQGLARLATGGVT